MLKKRQMNQIDQMTFTCELVSETSMSPLATSLGKRESTMTLYSFENNPDYYFIEWDIPSLDMCENIGIWCEDGSKVLCDYDGVFSLSEFAIEFLQKNGFDTSYAE
jgi:hypothetical protein